MIGIHGLALFSLSALLLAMTPGPDTAYILGRSSSRGRQCGITAVLGISTGICVHILAATAGISAILLTSARAFTIAKLLGGAYLLYLGIRMLLHKPQTSKSATQASCAQTSARQVFLQGFLTNVLNPKVALFFLAFVPQFINSTSHSKPLAFLVLGLTFNVIGTTWNFLVAVAMAQIATTLNGFERIQVWLERTMGAAFVLVAFRVATAERR